MVFVILSYLLHPIHRLLKPPVFCVVEAKNDNLDSGVPQCIAEMYAAQIFNENRGSETPFIYGAVTFGYEWKFLRLETKIALLDTDLYYLIRLPELLGVLQTIIDISKKQHLTIV